MNGYATAPAGFRAGFQANQDELEPDDTVLEGRDVARVIVYGPPGSGKTTLCKLISEKKGLVLINARTAVQDAMEQKTPMGLKAKGVLEEGKVLPDDTVLKLTCRVCVRLSTQGWIIDGFPAKSAQAEALTASGATPTIVLLFEAAETVVVDRCEQRRYDPETQAEYHLVANPPPDDPAVVERLEQRAEDTEENLKHRVPGNPKPET
ncbi:P-loop containing nucleoside triphosphate hydrolase protein [Baffinella frigidus]|nr:P-loop containing nucleoside triphosphate hydrolase protein [Cryptophyta sp. CCMP2293]